MKPELDDKAVRKKRGVLAYYARVLRVLLVLGFVNVLLIVAAREWLFFQRICCSGSQKLSGDCSMLVYRHRPGLDLVRAGGATERFARLSPIAVARML